MKFMCKWILKSTKSLVQQIFMQLPALVENMERMHENGIASLQK